MARILNLEAYPLAETISDLSYLVGTDVTDNKETKNFKIEDLKTHILPDPLIPGTFENATVVVDSDGQISSVTQGASGSSKWSFSLGGNDIYRNSNVGIGDFSAADPAQKLEVQGKVQVSGADAEFIGDINGAIRFNAKAGEALSKGDVVYISEISGNIPVVSKADASDSAKMPAFGLAFAAASLNSSVEVITFGTLSSIDTSAFSLGDTVYVSTTAGELTNTPPTGEANLLQNIGKVQRVQASSGSIKVGGAGRTNATPNLNEGSLFIGNSSNQSSTLAIGGANTFLKSDGTTASWGAITFNNDLQDVLDNGAISSNSSITQIEVFDAGTPTKKSKLTIFEYQIDMFSQDGSSGDSSSVFAGYGTAKIRGYNGSNFSGFEAQPDELKIELSDGTSDIKLEFDPTNKAVFTDTYTNSPGIQYAADYSANFTTRSLVDKDYVDTTFAPIGTYALVGTYTDGLVPRWNSTTNTLESGKIRDDGSTVSIGTVPSSSNTFFTTTNTLTTAILGQIKNDRSSQTHAIRARNENGGASNNVFATAFLAESTPTSSTPSGGIYVAGRFIQGNFSEFGNTGTIDLTSIQTEVDTNVNSDNVYAIKVDKVDINNSVSGNVYGLYLESHTGFGIVSGNKYGIYQNGSEKNYLAGQLQLNHTAGTAGQFLKSADTAGNAEWSSISASDVTGAVTATTGLDKRIAVFDGTDSVEGFSTFTYDSNTTSFKVSSPTDDDYSEMTNNGIVQVRSGNDANLDLICYGDQSKGAEIQSRKFRNVFGSPQALLNGDLIASHRILGATDALGTTSTSMLIETRAAENFSGTNQGVRYSIDTNALGEATPTERFAIESDGAIKFNNAYKFPTADGSANQILKTNGSGALTFQNDNGVTATSGAAQRLAVFDGTDSIEGDANLTYTGSTLAVNSNNPASPNNKSTVTGNYLASQVETNDANCLLYGYGDSGSFSGELILAQARGTIDSPTSTLINNILGEIQFQGATGAPAHRVGALIKAQSAEDFVVDSNLGTILKFQTVSLATSNLVDRYTIDGDGDHTFNGGVKVTSTTEGLQIPRWTTAQQTTNTTGWGTVNDGTMWFNTDTNQFMGWNGTSSVILG